MEKHNRSTGTYPFLPTDITPNVARPYAGQAKKPANSAISANFKTQKANIASKKR